MKKVLALVGDYYHSAGYLSTGLRNVLSSEYHLEIEEDYSDISWDELENYDVFILAGSVKISPEESNEIWLTDKHQELIHAYVSNGGKLFVLHSGLSGYPENGLLRELIKGHFLEHPVEHPEIEIKVVKGKTEDFLFQGIENFTIVDEQYFVDVDVNDTEVFVEAESKEYGRSIAGWLHNFGKGKVYCLTPGHTLEVLNTEMMKKLILDGVNC